MKRLLVAVGLLMLSAGTAIAHNRDDRGLLGINLGFPLYSYPTPAVSPYGTPPASLYGMPPAHGQPQVTYPNGFSYAPPKVYRQRDGARTIVEEIYKDGQLAERRVKCYPADWHGYR